MCAISGCLRELFRPSRVSELRRRWVPCSSVRTDNAMKDLVMSAGKLRSLRPFLDERPVGDEVCGGAEGQKSKLIMSLRRLTGIPKNREIHLKLRSDLLVRAHNEASHGAEDHD